MNSPYLDLLELVRSAYTDYVIIGKLDQAEIKSYTLENFLPEEVYSDKLLEEWAEANGFVKE